MDMPSYLQHCHKNYKLHPKFYKFLLQIIKYREVLTCALKAQDKNLKIELKSKYFIEMINF